MKVDDEHPVLIIKIECQNITHSKIKFLNYTEYEKYDFYNSHYVMINKELDEINSKNTFDNLDLDQAVDKYHTILENIIDNCCKTKIVKHNTYSKELKEKST